MRSQLTTIKEVTPQTKKWVVHVQVARKNLPQTAAKSTKTLQRLVLLDKEGTRVQTTIFGDDILLFKDTLKPLQKYEISNAVVKPIDPKYRYVEHIYQWTINGKTPIIELTDEAESSKIKRQLSLVRFGDLPKYVDALAEVDILAVVVDELHKKVVPTAFGPSTVQEFVIINEEKEPILMTLWNAFADNEAVAIADQSTEWTVILALRLKVSSYNNLSLSTKYSSSFLINPDLEEASALKTWVRQNEQLLKEIKAHNMYRQRKPESLRISDLPATSDYDATFKVLGSASIINTEKGYWYMSCNKCNRPINTEFNKAFPCMRCKKFAVATPRLCFQIELHDVSGTTTATIYGKYAEKVFSFTAIMLMEKETEENKHDIPVSEGSSDFIFLLKRSKQQNADYNVVGVSDLKVEE